VGLAYAQPTGHDIHFFFSRQAPPALGGPDTAPPEYAAQQILNNVLPGETVYLWAHIIDPDPGTWDIWQGINIFVDTGGAGTAYNIVSAFGNRWNTNSDFTWGDNPPPYDIYLVAVTEWGLGNQTEYTFGGMGLVPKYFAGGNTPATLFWAVAPIAFNEAPPYPHPVYLGIDQGGIARRGGVQGGDMVYFGFNDPAIRNDAFGQTSALPDLYLIPEPASLLLLGLAGLALRRR